ncbi:DUF2703 domain-containing protein [Cereibacter sphaeroides]|uniref:DUF2703 domain-containing protein n=1 Tax=Cereibacter sphaeroides TaxID=1063 RepID=UPI001F3480B0|nr:DUF2703 domain-containing protein [Cereibacter sphaeroides]MCE6950849.1 DUF2703 domain-containing protein [Cereibacter sphaeroides]
MRTLPIIWQRLVSADGTTCPRCRGTGEEVRRAVARLRPMLEPLGIAPGLQVKEIDEASFAADTLQSNQILIAGQPLDAWLGGRTGSSRCCDQCGDNECRTLELEDQAYEVIPEELILKAALKAASALATSSRGDV